MDILPHHFRICKIFGMWYTDHDDYFWLKMSCRFVVLLFLGIFNLSQIVGLVVLRGNVDEMIEVLFTAMTYFGLLLKLFNFILRRDEMCELLQEFRSPVCQPITQDEVRIIEKQTRNIRNILYIYMTLALFSGFPMLISSLLSFLHNEVYLPFKAYTPYDISISKYYLISYSIQSISMVFGIILNVSMDSMTYAFIMLATSQYEINGTRYMNSTTPINDCIKHQMLLQKLNFKIQVFFIKVTVPLFFFSLITLCATVFQISQVSVISLQFLSSILYLGGILLETFLYCWYGNELLLKSQNVMDKIYESNWLDYDSQERRNLWFAMLSADRGVHISYHGQCRLSLTTFIWVIKTSYAAFNFLKQA